MEKVARIILTVVLAIVLNVEAEAQFRSLSEVENEMRQDRIALEKADKNPTKVADQYELGRLYIACNQYDKGIKWMRLAANKNYKKAQEHLVMIYALMDRPKSFYWAKKLANTGDPEYEYITGYMLENGMGCTKNIKEAKLWYQRAGKKGNKDANEALARLGVNDLPLAQRVDVGLMAHFSFDSEDKVCSKGLSGRCEGIVHFANGHGSSNYMELKGIEKPGCYHVYNSSSLNLNDAWTFSIFVKINSRLSMDGWGYRCENGAQTIMAKSHDRNGFAILCHINDNKFSTWIAAMDKKWVSGVGGNIPGDFLNKWVHVAYTYEKNTFKVYLNGQLVKTQESKGDFAGANSRDLFFGKFSDTWYPLNGCLDEARFYNRALSEAEIKILTSKY